MRRAERGVVLLDVLIAVAVFAVSGIGAVALLAQGAAAMHQSRVAEDELAGAERLLAGATLLTRPELEARLGTRPAGPFLLRVSRSGEALFALSVADADSVPLIQTLVYRPAP